MFDSKIETVKMEKLNLDLECYLDLLNGTGIRLASVESFDKKNEKVYNGLQSEFFGKDFGDDAAFAERYTCKCKKYVGKMYEGVMCELCNTEVEFHDADLSRTGWIILDHFSVMSPLYIAKISDALGTSEGEKVFNRIIEIDYYEGDTPEYTDKELLELKKHPFLHKGMIWLKENIVEVLEFYKKKKPNKAALFDELLADQDKMFTSCIPVYTSLLRTELPGVKGSKVFKMKVNTIYQAIIKMVNYINRFQPKDFNHDTLTTIQIQLATIVNELMEIFNVTFTELTSKKGIITSKVMGGRYNFSARNIITPSSGRLRADEIEIGYITFMELFRYEIVNIYAKLQGCTIMEASNVWKKGLVHPNNTLFNIIKHMTTDKECKKRLWVLISRNPCINYGSFMCMRIASVREDINDKTMSLPTNCLKTMGADLTLRRGRVEERSSIVKLCERLTSGVAQIRLCS